MVKGLIAWFPDTTDRFFCICKERFEGSSHSSQERSSGQRVDPLYKPLTSSRTTDRSLPSNHKKEASPSCGPLVGENSNLEKPYLRLTTFPRKEDVRPLKVLIKSLAHIKCRYLQTEDFDWANEQLKSVRQDMTVQRLRNRFVLDVYETHARILLEHGDLDEFNQCQTMIRSLTEGPRSCSEGEKAKDALGVHFGGDDDPSASTDDRASDAPLVQTSESQDEFRGYAILYALVRNTSMELKTELARAKSLGQNAKATTSCSCHAISVVQAVDDHDYRTFFRLYESAPHLSAYLMDFLVKRTYLLLVRVFRLTGQSFSKLAYPNRSVIACVTSQEFAIVQSNGFWQRTVPMSQWNISVNVCAFKIWTKHDAICNNVVPCLLTKMAAPTDPRFGSIAKPAAAPRTIVLARHRTTPRTHARNTLHAGCIGGDCPTSNGAFDGICIE